MKNKESLIQAFLRGRLSEQDLPDFQHFAETDPDFSKEVAHRMAVRDVVRAGKGSHLQLQYAAWKRRRLLRQVATAAAILLGMFAIVWVAFFKNPHPDWQPDPDALKKLEQVVASAEQDEWQAALQEKNPERLLALAKNFYGEHRHEFENYPGRCYEAAVVRLSLDADEKRDLREIAEQLEVNLRSRQPRQDTPLLLAETYAYLGEHKKGLQILKENTQSLEGLPPRIAEYYEQF